MCHSLSPGTVHNRNRASGVTQPLFAYRWPNSDRCVPRPLQETKASLPDNEYLQKCNETDATDECQPILTAPFLRLSGFPQSMHGSHRPLTMCCSLPPPYAACMWLPTAQCRCTRPAMQRYRCVECKMQKPPSPLFFSFACQRSCQDSCDRRVSQRCEWEMRSKGWDKHDPFRIQRSLDGFL